MTGPHTLPVSAMSSNESSSLFADSLYASHVEAAAMAALPSVNYQSAAAHELASLHAPAACDPGHLTKEGNSERTLISSILLKSAAVITPKSAAK